MRQWGTRDNSHVIKHVRRYAIAAFAILTMSAIGVVLSEGDTRAAMASVGVLVGNMTAGMVFIHKSRSLPLRERRAWSLVGRGLMIAASGIVVVALWGVFAGEPPAFGITDVVFVAGYIVILIGIAALPHTDGDNWQRSRTALDAAIGAVSIGALAWVFLINPIVTGLEGAPLSAQVFGTAYPLVDVGIVIVVVLVTTRRTTRRFDVRMLALAAAVILQGIGDLSLLIGGYDASLVDAEPLFLVYLGAAAMFLTTALIVDQLPVEREYADRRASLWSMFVPYAAAVVMVATLLHLLWDTELAPGDRVLVAASVIVAVLVVVRQAIAIRENQIVVEGQRSELVSSISHELRTPLTAMVGFMALLQDDKSLSTTERQEMMAVVVEQTNYLERLVEDLLGLSRGDLKRMELTVSEHDVKTVIDRAITSAPINPAHVSVEVAPNLVAVIDGGRIQQILVNLLTNASWYGGADTLVCAFDRAGGLVIEVHDSGAGVPKKHELTIWERFERGENRYNANVPGSGIGLAMVRNIAESHGGTASYQRSKRLGGACFVIDLPGRVGKQRPIAIVSSSTMAIG